MNIDWAHFTPWTSLAGGILLGIASAMMVLLSGRILGISGILGGLLAPRIGDIGWRVAFLLGMGASPMVFAALMPPELLPLVRIDASEPLIALAGVLVGLGTRYGSGCTSGHGVCGLSRLSPRSLVATLGFMAAGFATVYLLRHAF
jgi:uncharacterized membrane protein YedE/YeeE